LTDTSSRASDPVTRIAWPPGPTASCASTAARLTKTAFENPAPGRRTAAATGDGKSLACHATTASPRSPIPALMMVSPPVAYPARSGAPNVADPGSRNAASTA
jgi:hypothetical protein